MQTGYIKLLKATYFTGKPFSPNTMLEFHRLATCDVSLVKKLLETVKVGLHHFKKAIHTVLTMCFSHCKNIMKGNSSAYHPWVLLWSFFVHFNLLSHANFLFATPVINISCRRLCLHHKGGELCVIMIHKYQNNTQVEISKFPFNKQISSWTGLPWSTYISSSSHLQPKPHVHTSFPFVIWFLYFLGAFNFELCPSALLFCFWTMTALVMNCMLFFTALSDSCATWCFACVFCFSIAEMFACGPG